MTGFLFDLRYALRLLGRNRGFATMAILTLALGVGANSAIFAVVHAVLFRAPVYPDPGQVVAVTRVTPQNQADNHAAADYLDIRRDSRSFSALAAYRQDVLDLSSGNADPERLSGAQVSVSFFDVFEVPAFVGRTFSEHRDDPRGERLVVLGHGLWLRRFGGDRSMVGKTIRVNREPCTVVGVMPPAFQLPGDAEAWIMARDHVPSPPLSVEGDLLANRQVHYFNAVGRLRAGVSVEQARPTWRRLRASWHLDIRRPTRARGSAPCPSARSRSVTRGRACSSCLPRLGSCCSLHARTSRA